MSLCNVVKELMAPICRHDEHYHMQLILSGCVSGRPRASRDRSTSEPMCVLTMFVTDKRFLSRELVDDMYTVFSSVWLDGNGGASPGESSEKPVVTRSLFVFICYIYLVRVLCEMSESVAVLGLCPTSWDELESAMYRYPCEKLDSLLDNVNSQHLNEIHRYLFNTDLRIPIPTQVSSPCMSLLRAKEYDHDPDVPVSGCVIWRRRRVREREPCFARLAEALRRNVGDSLFGNPMYTMAKVLVERFCRSSGRFMLPIGKRTLCGNVSSRRVDRSVCCASATHEKVSPSTPKIIMFALSVSLRNGIISSLIDLPVMCYCKTKCERYMVPGALLASMCRNCGHCLNLGKEKLACGAGFPLNSMFYYRDRQEKSVVYSTHGELAHCSLCGSQYLDTESIYEILEDDTSGYRSVGVIWRAITGSNSACNVYCNNTHFDIIVPCSSRTCFSTVVLRKVTVNKLMRLVSHGNEFLCQLCQHACRETCADEEGSELCKGCRLSRLFGCNQHVNHSAVGWQPAATDRGGQER